MSFKVLTRASFIIWAIVITFLSIIPYPNNSDLLVSVKLTGSGFVMHSMAYTIGTLFCCYSFRWNSITFILLSSFSVFLYGVFLEIVQIYLPYRTFNPKDIVANASGVALFVFVWAIYSHFFKRKQVIDN